MTAEITASESIQAWRRRVNYPIYLPAELGSARSLLIREGRGAFVSSLYRLADSGVASAAAALAVLSLYGDLSGSKDPTKAVSICKRFADSDDDYGSYVLGWSYVACGDQVSALRYMSRAAERLFPPALLGLASFAWNGIGVDHRQDDIALRFVDGATGLNHAFAPVMRSAFAISGRLGWVRRLYGWSSYPVALTRFALATRRDVFSSLVFHINLDARNTILRLDSRNTSRANQSAANM